jgi:uncharacterized delta-60 repeat protein
MINPRDLSFSKASSVHETFLQAKGIREPAMKFFIVCICSWFFSLVSLGAQTVDTFDPNANGTVYGTAIQPDGKVLLVGAFYQVGGWPRENIARVNSDGSLDKSFNPGANSSVNSLVLQPDGKIIVGGNFTRVAGQACTNLARLNADGTLDTSFSSYASGLVSCALLQPDGRIVIGGSFTNIGGQPCNRIARVNNDGTLDTNFNASASSLVYTMALQADGKILVGGNFTNLDGAAVARIGRLNSDGTLDGSFNSSANAVVMCLALQADNMILAGGPFTNLAGVPRRCIGRLNSDGSIDPSFNPNASNTVTAITVQANGKILIGGFFTALAGGSRNHIARLNTGGTLDGTFNPGANADVYTISLHPDGKILVGGAFTNLAGGLRNYIGRMTNNDAATQTLTFTPSTVTWMRGGASPEIWNVGFEFSTNGTDWNYLTDGVRLAGGWQATGVAIPGNSSVRARGSIVVSGAGACSRSLHQAVAGIPVITGQPSDLESLPATNVIFSVTVGGTLPLVYQWQFKGTNLTNGPKITGSTNASLTLSNLTVTNAGNYAVIVTNSYGSVTSQVVALKIVRPTTNDSFNIPTLGPIYANTVQNDGKMIIAGSFNYALNGSVYGGVARLNMDGSLDASFRARGNIGYALAMQRGGGILLGASYGLAQLNADGTTNALFTSGANGTVYSLATQPDGKILVAGNFTLLGNQPHNHIARLNADGTVDTNFTAGADGAVNSVALQANGQIVIGGSFTNVNAIPCHNLGRLNSDGTLDPGFNIGASNAISSVAVQPDGKILISGSLSMLNGEYVNNYLARMNSDGTQDTTFNPYIAYELSAAVNSFAIQSDGKIFIGGNFANLSGVNSSHLCFARLNTDGTTDGTFSGSASAVVYSAGIQYDGTILVAGGFGGLYDAVSYAARYGFGKLKNTETVTQEVHYDGSTVTWVRNGPGPEVSWAVFESSVDGTNWSPIGAGTYTNRNWQLTGISLPSSANVRARGYVASGYHNGSGWIVEARSGPPFFVVQPLGSTNSANLPFSISGFATGTLPIAYQWLKNGVQVTNDVIISGAQSPNLAMRSFIIQHVGDYTLVASNILGCTTSSVATLVLSKPVITSQPSSVTTNAGATVTFSITATGLAPLSYQWFKETNALSDGGNISGSLSPTLTLSNVVMGDGGAYSLMISNSVAAGNSLNATLTVIGPPSDPPTIVGGTEVLDLGANGFGFDVGAEAGQTIVVETSTNLIDWQPVFTNVIVTSPVHFQDLNAITNRTGFYRIRLQ